MCAVRYAGTLLQGGAVEFEVENGVITSVAPIKDSPALPWIMPVLVDLQQNGAMGYSFSNLKSPEELRAITETLYRHGVGRVQATTVSVPVETLTASMQLLARECDNDPVLNKVIFGLFHEGIFMSFEEGWRGDHDLECIKKPDWDLFRKIDDASGNRFVTINTVPEVPGAMEFISQAVAAGKKISLGHCNPTTDEIREAVERGADRVTHFANGASPLVHRFKNPFWEFLNNYNLKLGLICDGFHLPPETVSVALKIKEPEKCLPVSDASSYSGLQPGIYGNGKRQLEANGYLHVIGKDILAGSSCQQNTCVNFLMQKLGFSFPKAWRQCSLIPARSVGLTLPEIKVGDEASFVICREENKTAVIDRTVIMGTEYPFA
ncbi:MAG: amidohydrolase family protein [Lentisphaeria bacterium]|nr:amidohydrolase family protein [Lentisphaeria bacterium]